MKIYRWHLGYVYNNDGKLINHRPLLKVIINPFLRPFKKCIASNINYSDMTVKYVFIDCDYVPFFKGISEMKYFLPNGYYVIKKEMFF